jgi:hypothetical protein
VKIVSEHEPQFWGFESEAEWEAASKARAEKDQQEFYDDVIKFIGGESNDIRPGTNGMAMAEIAKRLVAESPDLVAAEKRRELIEAVETIFHRDHCVEVDLRKLTNTSGPEDATSDTNLSTLLAAMTNQRPSPADGPGNNRDDHDGGRPADDHHAAVHGQQAKAEEDQDNTKYGVKFIGYSAFVGAHENGHEVDYAQLDFVTGAASVKTDCGWVIAPSRAELSSIVAALPTRKREIRELLRQRAAQTANQQLAETPGEDDPGLIELGNNTIRIEPGTKVNNFIRQVRARFSAIEQLLEQAEQIGSQITRRPYEEYIDEIDRTGLCRIEVHGFGVFHDGKLIYRPDYRIALTDGPNVLKVQKMPQKANPNSESLH